MFKWATLELLQYRDSRVCCSSLAVTGKDTVVGHPLASERLDGKRHFKLYDARLLQCHIIS